MITSQPMREARIILPARDNDGESLAVIHGQLRKELCKEFGGFTATPSCGGWIDPMTGTYYEDAGHAYDVAMQDSHANREALTRIAERYCAKAKQEAIYCRFPNGAVAILAPAAANAEVAA